MPPSAKKRRLAIFDIDGTVFRSSLLIEVFNALVQEGVFPKRAGREVEKGLVSWLDRKGHYDDYLMPLVRVYYSHLKGKRVDKVEAVINRVVDGQRDRVYRYTRDLITGLREQDYLLLAISNSQEAKVKRFSQVAGFDAAIGRSLEVRNGRYTGKNIIEGKIFPIDVKLDKPDLLKSFLRKNNIEADLANSIAVGDSEGDTAILSVVGHPIAFNPSYELARIAEKKNWAIVVERKDVMYHVHDADIMVAKERPHKKNRAKKRA
jgi:HAD superfamily hydrolase (TIGR01490 family)